MSAISGFINTIRNAVYGEQVRGAIISALEQCYSDVNAPSLQTEAFETALNEAYAGGILDIQTVTSFADMTNDKIIYRYNGTAAGKQKGLYYFSALSDSWVLIGSEIQMVSLLSQMTDVNDIYKYIGTETGMVQNSLYCHNGTSWAPISPPTDTTLSIQGRAADAKVVGERFKTVEENAISTQAKSLLIDILKQFVFINPEVLSLIRQLEIELDVPIYRSGSSLVINGNVNALLNGAELIIS